MSDQLRGIYSRLERFGSMVTPNETLIVLRDLHDRLNKVEKSNEELEKPAKTRRRTNKVSGGDVSSS